MPAASPFAALVLATLFAAASGASQAPALAPALTPALTPALGGFDPVALCGGEQRPGKPEFGERRGAFHYLFADAGSLATFRADPARYEIQLGGACARMGPLSGAGDPQRWLVHGERIYVFASDQCRAGFERRPDAFLDPDVPRPADAPWDSPDGEALLARAAAAHGGAERLRALRTYRHERRSTKEGMTEHWRLQLRLPDGWRSDHDYLQGDKAWRYAQVVAGGDAFLVTDTATLREAPDMSAAARREVMHAAMREPVWLLRAAVAGPVMAARRGPATVGGVAVELVEVWHDGATTTWGVDADGRLRTARFRGRGPGLWFGAVELVFDDFQTVGAVLVPATVHATFDGAAAPGLTEQRQHLEVDAELSAALFTRPR